MRRVLIATIAGTLTGLLVAACGTPPHPKAPPRPLTTTTVSAPATTTTTTTTTTVPPPPPTTARPAPPAITTPPRPVVTQCPADIVALIEKHWARFGPDVVQWAIGIAWRESNCRPDVVSPSQCWSVFQMALPLHADIYAAAGYPDWYAVRYDAEASIAAAALLYASSGPSPWRL